MTSLHWAELRFRVPLSRWSAISSAMKVLRSTSWRPFLRRLGAELALRCVGEPGAPERILILAMAPLRPCRAMASLKGCRSVSTDELVSEDVGRLGDTIASLGGALELRGGGALPQRKLIRSSRRIVRLLFFTHARTSLFRL